MRITSFICPDLSRSPEIIEEVCKILEAQIVGLQLDATFGKAQPEAIGDRAAFISAQFARYQARSLDPWSLVISNRAMDDGMIAVHIRLPYPHLAQFAGVTMIELDLPNAIDDDLTGSLLATIGDVSQAWHGTAQLLMEYASEPLVRLMDRPLLPHNLKFDNGAIRRGPNVPKHLVPPALQWLHYFSPQTCKLLDFPNRPNDSQWLWRSEPTQRGAWLLQVTCERLDMRRPVHCDALRRAYERFRDVWVPRP